MPSFTTKGYSQYGADMGRRSSSGGPASLPKGTKLSLQRVRLDSGGYDPGGAYWGLGAPIYCVSDPAGDFEQYHRAWSREDVKSLYPQCKFFR